VDASAQGMFKNAILLLIDGGLRLKRPRIYSMAANALNITNN
jgi:hypothetical protein